jgi:hypothetical protein
MSDYTPLEPSALTAAAQRALGPGPGRSMAARGLLPLAPADQLAVLYQLALDPDANLANAARATAGGLPEKLLTGTLADTSLDPRVLDYFGTLVTDKPAAFEAVVLNPSTGDATIAKLAAKAGQKEVELIATNEQRLLRHPDIIAAMYMNRHARMSTIDRVVELAVRNNIRVPGLAAWDEVARALSGDIAGSENDALLEAVLDVPRDDSALTTGDAEQALPEDDGGTDVSHASQLLLLTVARPGVAPVRVPLKRSRMLLGSADTADAKVPNAPASWLAVQLTDRGATVVVIGTNERYDLAANQSVQLAAARLQLTPLPFRDLPVSSKIRAATLGDAFIRGEAIRDPLRLVALAAIKSPGVTEIEAARYAGNQILSEDVIRYIASKREWTKIYGVKVSLCRNPKAPIAEVTRMMPFLRERDLQAIVKSKGVPSAVVAQARKLQMTRGGKK